MTKCSRCRVRHARRVGVACGIALIVAFAGALTDTHRAYAQQTVALLPDSTAARLVEFYNLDATTRLTGDAHIGVATSVRGGVAVLGGTLTIEGVVDGDVAVINGDLVMRGPGARVTGSITVAGGTATIPDPSAVGGRVSVYREPLRYRSVGGRLAVADTNDESGLAAGVDLPFGRTDLLVAAHGAYNRVEGLPIAIGPRIRIGGSHPLTARAVVIARTAAASELEPERFGYDIRIEQQVVPAAGLSAGIRLYSEVATIEALGVSDRESALSTFILHDDFRDHYEREGWSLYGRMARPGTPYRFEFAYRDEEHTSTPAADPFTLLYGGRAWRPEPSVAEGALRSIEASVEYDTRNEERDPSTGWLVGVTIEQGLGGSLDNEGAFDPDQGTLTRPARTGYRTALFDVRRYARLSPYARLSFRAYAAGSLDIRALPPQRQHALGGEGTLPGYAPFEFDCGARINSVILRGDIMHPYYGCDQVALVQMEYQAAFPFARRIAESIGISANIGQAVRWVAFFDAGRAWNEPDSRDGRLGGNDDFSADAGLGLRLGPIGAYWAVPLSGRGRGINFFVRLGPRI